MQSADGVAAVSRSLPLLDGHRLQKAVIRSAATPPPLVDPTRGFAQAQNPPFEGWGGVRGWLAGVEELGARVV